MRNRKSINVGIFPVALAAIALALPLHKSYGEQKSVSGLFVFSKKCRERLKQNYVNDPYISCVTTFPFELTSDVIAAPFILTANYDVITDNSADSSAGTTGTSHHQTTERKKEEIKQYKQTMLYAVSSDAVNFAASPDREPSIELAKFIESLMPDFPGESPREINARIVQTHKNILAYIGENL